MGQARGIVSIRITAGQTIDALPQEIFEAVLDLAIKIQNKQVGEMKVSHAPGC